MTCETWMLGSIRGRRVVSPGLHFQSRRPALRRTQRPRAAKKRSVPSGPKLGYTRRLIARSEKQNTLSLDGNSEHLMAHEPGEKPGEWINPRCISET